jgi:hypothetical protein
VGGGHREGGGRLRQADDEDEVAGRAMRHQYEEEETGRRKVALRACAEEEVGRGSTWSPVPDAPPEHKGRYPPPAGRATRRRAEDEEEGAGRATRRQDEDQSKQEWQSKQEAHL